MGHQRPRVRFVRTKSCFDDGPAMADGHVNDKKEKWSLLVVLRHKERIQMHPPQQ